jgi:hypothetical protein
MDEVNTNQTPSEESSEMSFTDKVMNVYSAPRELFDGIAKSEKKNSNWSIPLILTMIVGIISIFVAFSQAPIQDQVREQQEKGVQKQVESGKMTQEQADKAMSIIPKPGSPLFMAISAVGVAFVTAAMLFGFALGFWLVGKWVFKAPATYGKVLEVIGLSMYILVLGSIVTLLLIVATGSIYATPSLALAVSHFDPTNKVDKLLASVNLVTFWYLAVVSVGLGKIFSVSATKALVAVGVLWAVWTGTTVLIGFGM